jgi:type IV pilus assembly protein PilQ
MRKTTRAFWTSLLVTALMISFSFAAVPSGDTAKTGKSGMTSYRITAVNWEQSPEEYRLRIKGGSAPTYTMYELFEPLRVIIDIADASLESSASLPLDLPKGPVSRVSGKVIAEKKPSITRIELYLNEEHDYTVDRTDNDIVVRFPTRSTEAPITAVANTPAAMKYSADVVPTETSTTDKAIGSADKQPLTDDTISSLIEASHATKVNDIEVTKDLHETKIYLKADGPIKNYKKVLLPKNTAANRPSRMYLDLNKLRLSKSYETRLVGTAALDKIRTAKRQDGFRIVFDSTLDQLFDYSINERPDGLLITIKEPTSIKTASNRVPTETKTPKSLPQPEMELPLTVNKTGEASMSTAMGDNESEPVKPSLSRVPLDDSKFAENTGVAIKKSSKTPSSQMDMTFAGYNKQRITVDFYKIDLHNVFRLFGEISNLNIVVDEAVNGSLTLALNDVPWDFALDIILNLKDLQKEERFNTIVISPKSKSFTWPERALDNVEFKSDIKIEQAEQAEGGIKISKRLEVPEYVVEAKKLIHQGNISERKGDFATAISLYEEAFGKWSDNAKLAKRIAALCLVNAEQNAKAVHYARATLKLSPEDGDAALQAAIGLARMKRTAEAKEFFDMSVAGDKPSSEALASYSTFCEEQLDFNCSLNQLKRHEELHGDNLDTMLSKARIYDKQNKQDLAAKEYRAILLSGYDIPADLARYVKGRAALAGR